MFSYTFSDNAIKNEFSGSFVSPSIIPKVLVPLVVIRQISRQTTLSNLVAFFTDIKKKIKKDYNNMDVICFEIKHKKNILNNAKKK